VENKIKEGERKMTEIEELKDKISKLISEQIAVYSK
jgi:hypothetical protein